MSHLTPSIQSAIQKNLTSRCHHVSDFQFQSIGGGSINDTYRIAGGTNLFFCKINSAVKFPGLFIKEKDGLELIAKENIIKTPGIIDCFQLEGKQILVLDWIREGERNDNFWRKFGEQLACLHQHSNEFFGSAENNYMGSVRQSNRQNHLWTEFFAVERLQVMVERCYEKNLLIQKHLKKFETLYQKLSSIFEIEKPSLVHGDLWSGNFMCDQNGEPVLIDPAVYYGHRSVDLAMTNLFGGFRPPFYQAYHYHFPFPPNYNEQWQVCNLYPLLIHLFLFGSSYLPQIESSLKQLS